MTSIPDNQELQTIPDCDFVPMHESLDPMSNIPFSYNEAKINLLRDTSSLQMSCWLFFCVPFNLSSGHKPYKNLGHKCL